LPRISVLPRGALSIEGDAVDLGALPHRIHDPVDYWAARTPHAPALVDATIGTLTYAALREAVAATAVILAQASVRAGDRVLIVNENSAATVAALFATSQLDAWAVLVNARLARVEIDRIRQHARPKAIVFTHEVSQEAAAHATHHGATAGATTTAGSIRIVGGLQSEAEPVAASGESQVAAVIYTSGTTGSPKGVMLTHRSLLFSAAASGRLRRIVSEDSVIQLLPISHVFGLASVLLCVIIAGARVLLVPRFDPAQLADALQSGITILQGVPAMYAKLLEHLESTGRALVAPCLRYLSAGGSPLDIDWKRSIERRLGLPLNNGYGLTETSSAVALTRVEAPRDDDSVGLPLPGVEVRFVGTDGLDVADGQIGEGLVRGPDVMRGYYRDETATRAALSDDGWFRTGDLGYRGADGHLFIVGRLKELIIRSGFNVYPAEVETALNSHPDVVQSAVIGRKAGGNEEVVAFVESKPGSVLQPSSLHDHVRERLAAYKCPQHIFMLEKLPASPTGKILKAPLAPLAEELIVK